MPPLWVNEHSIKQGRAWSRSPSVAGISLRSCVPLAQPGWLAGASTELSPGLGHLIRLNLPAFVPVSRLQEGPLPPNHPLLCSVFPPPSQIPPSSPDLTTEARNACGLAPSGDQHSPFTPPGWSVSFVLCWVPSASADCA